MTPCTTLIAPYLYPIEWTGAAPKTKEPVELPPLMLHIFQHIKSTGKTSLPAISRALGITKFKVNIIIERLIKRGLLCATSRPASCTNPQTKFYEAQ